MSTGFVQARAGSKASAQDSRQTRAGIRFDAGKPAALLKFLARQPAAERAGIREHLQRDGSPKALALLAGLERRWAARPAPGEPPA